MRDYLKQAAISTQRMEDFVGMTTANPEYYDNPLYGDPIDAFQLDKLDESLAKLNAESNSVKKEVEAALMEPIMGLSLQLDGESFRGLIKQQGDCVVYCMLLVKALKDLAKYYKQYGHLIRRMDWPHLHTEFLSSAPHKSEYCCEWL